MQCIICSFIGNEPMQFIALQFAPTKPVCTNCASSLGSTARARLLDGVKFYPADPKPKEDFGGILPKGDWTP